MFEAMKVVDMRRLLVESKQFTEETAEKIKGKSNLAYEILQLRDKGLINLPGPKPVIIDSKTDIDDVDQIFNDATPEIETPVELPTVTNQVNERVYNVTDEDWQGFVLSKMDQETEFFKGAPKVCGLRRMTELLLGDIIFSGPIQIFPATSLEGNGRASVVYSVDIAWKLGLSPYADYINLPKRKFTACAEAWDGNVPQGIYQTFPLAIAETRAEARALRKALHLTVISAEEIGTEVTVDTPVVQSDWNPEDIASSQQTNSISILCERVGVNFGKLVPDLKKLTKQEAVVILKQLNSYQSGETVPEELKAKE